MTSKASEARPCSCFTTSGRPCRAWSIKGTDPPLCAIHSGRTKGAGAPPGNQNRSEHSFYSRFFTLDELADILDEADVPALSAEITAAKVAIRRVLAYLEHHNGQHLPPESFKATIALIFTGTATVARLMRHQRALSGDAADGLNEAIATALDELATQWDLESIG